MRPAWSPTIACSLYHAAWGVRMTFSRSRSGCGFGSGSGSVVSRAQPAIRPASSARTSAAVSTMGPRAQLIRNAVGFIWAKVVSFIIPRVSGESGGCTDTKSDSRSSAASSCFSPGAGNWPAFTNGS